MVALLTGAGAAAASPAGEVPRLVFPVLGPVSYVDDFGDARGQGGHQGNDLMAPRRALAVAAEAGTVKFWTTSSRAGCMLYLYGASGTTYLYIHLNNDLTDGNDNGGGCVPGVAFTKAMRSGARVPAGEPLGYVGDSGDADGGNPHLHFEVHPGGGAATSPFPHLREARRLLFAAARGSTFTLALSGTVVSAAGEALNLKLREVRSWPGGRRIRQTGLTVNLSVPETASLEGPPGLSFPALELLTQGLPVTVWTKPAKVTLPAQAGEKGALAAARVVVKRP
ncbi:MAG: M23 family metallopeptidase [Actinobacteria bacterium]|nr:M23 family metallopeptidase [Actinomycetota bacterium]